MAIFGSMLTILDGDQDNILRCITNSYVRVVCSTTLVIERCLFRYQRLAETGLGHGHDRWFNYVVRLGGADELWVLWFSDDWSMRWQTSLAIVQNSRWTSFLNNVNISGSWVLSWSVRYFTLTGLFLLLRMLLGKQQAIFVVSWQAAGGLKCDILFR